MSAARFLRCLRHTPVLRHAFVATMLRACAPCLRALRLSFYAYSIRATPMMLMLMRALAWRFLMAMPLFAAAAMR